MPSVGREGQLSLPHNAGGLGSAVENGGLGWGFLKVGKDGNISSVTSGIVPSAPRLADSEQGAEMGGEGKVRLEEGLASSLSFLSKHGTHRA